MELALTATVSPLQEKLTNTSESSKAHQPAILCATMGKAKTKREKPLFWKSDARWPAQKSRPDHWVAYAIVDQQWKMVTSINAEAIELYNITKDPYEKIDLKGDYPEVVSQLSKKLADWKASLPDQPDENCFSNERKK